MATRHIRDLTNDDRGIILTLGATDDTRVRFVSVEDAPGSRVLTVIDREGEEKQVRLSAHTVLTLEDPYDDLI